MAAPEQSYVTATDGAISALFERYENFKMVDAHKTSLLEDVMLRYQDLAEALRQERVDHARERKWLGEDLEAAAQRILRFQHVLDTNPFVLVLIDGADLVFRNSFFQDGDVGGRRCAALLHQAINEYAFSSVDDLPPDTKIFIRIFADIEELTTMCLQSGIVDQSSKIRGCIRGFVQTRATFDIVNVYSQGRESIIDKVEAQLYQHVDDYHCRQIILGCSDDGIYGPILEKISRDSSSHQRISLLSGIPFGTAFDKLPFETTRVPTIFRNTSMESHKAVDHIRELEPLPTHMLPSVIGTPATMATMGVLTPPLSTPTVSVRSDSRLERLPPPMTPVTSSNTPVETAKSKPMTWASISKKAAILPVTVSEKLSSKEPSVPPIRRNKNGQRIDPTPPNYVKADVNRIKRLKLCNAYYLRGDCVNADHKCEHEHSYKATKADIQTLRLVARMSACIHGSSCDDEKCIYGHVCPFPQAKEGSMRGKGCLNGEHCRFPSEMHGMDMIPVKTTKIT